MEISKNLQSYKYLKYLLIIILGSILITLSAKIKIPFYPVPMTMQTFVVVMLGIVLGSKIGSATVLLYLLEGLFGLPVFSNSPEKGVGLIYFTGPTMGYLIGFLFAAYTAGKIRLDANYYDIIFKIVFSVLIIYCLGMLWLGNLIGWDKPVFNLGAKPFLLAELLKITILILSAKFLLKFRKFI
tara:strand:- start:41 stop:592 length:552 start_codon:yes stop_codon:yes gene_type:complete